VVKGRELMKERHLLLDYLINFSVAFLMCFISTQTDEFQNFLNI